MLQVEFFSRCLKLWDLEFGLCRPDLQLLGSPERTIFRTVLETQNEELWLLEELSEQSLPHKERIAAHLEELHEKGLPVANIRRGHDGRFIQTLDGRFWQLSAFYQGHDLDRDTYWQDAWRGKELAGFLTELYRAGKNVASTAPFHLHEYVLRIEDDTRRHHPHVHARLAAVFAMLREKLPGDTALPQCFSHGDPHPLNMIWGQDRIIAALDWEFCGYKCVLYDPALVLGCVGCEAENALQGPFARAFLDELRFHKVLSADLEAHLPAWLIGVRVGWLAEWLRRHDREMIEFEVYYMNMLFERFVTTTCEEARRL